MKRAQTQNQANKASLPLTPPGAAGSSPHLASSACTDAKQKTGFKTHRLMGESTGITKDRSQNYSCLTLIKSSKFFSIRPSFTSTVCNSICAGPDILLTHAHVCMYVCEHICSSHDCPLFNIYEFAVLFSHLTSYGHQTFFLYPFQFTPFSNSHTWLGSHLFETLPRAVS